MKIDEILDQLDVEDQDMLLYLLSAQTDNGNFLVAARRVADLVTDHTIHSVGVSAVLRWRRRFLELNSDETV
jgi:hypothetical protein